MFNRRDMLPNSHNGFHRRVPLHCAGLCLILAVLFLYNPFFTIYGSSGVSAVRHPLSFRGTVASSELRCSVVKQVQPKIEVLGEASLDAAKLPEASCPNTVALPDEPLHSPREAVLESLWFRPPPLLLSIA
jgi:hypothetical protein